MGAGIKNRTLWMDASSLGIGLIGIGVMGLGYRINGLLNPD